MFRTTNLLVAVALLVAALLLPGTQRAQAAETGVTPQGGCIGPICGHVVNLLDSRSVLVTMNWCCTDNRWVPPQSGTAGWGDVDGVFVPSGCSFGVLRNFVPVTWGHGWHRISTGEFIVVHRAGCLG